MPPLPAVAKVVRVTVPFQIGPTQVGQIRFFIAYAGGSPTVAQLATFCDSVANAWGTNMKSLHGSNITQLQVTCVDLNSATGAVAQGTVTNVGTRAGAILSGGVSTMIQFLIARRYRGGKPKIFPPLGTQTDLSSPQTWSNAFVSAVGTGWNAFIAAVIAAPWAAGGPLSQVNVSYFSGFTVVTNPITHRARNVPTLRGTPVQDTVGSISVEPGIASQRRRNNV